MKVIRKYYFFPLILFLSLFIDGQISFIISHLIPNSLHPTSFLFLYGFVLLSLYFSEIASIWLGIFFGFCFDVYFLNTIGIAFLLLPLLQMIIFRCNQIVLANRFTRFFSFFSSCHHCLIPICTSSYTKEASFPASLLLTFFGISGFK